MKKIWIILLFFLVTCAFIIRFYQSSFTQDLSFMGIGAQIFLEDDFIHPHKINKEDFKERDAIEVVKENTEAMDFYRDYHENMKSVSDYKWFATVEFKKKENQYLVIMRESKIESPFVCKALVDKEKQNVIESICGHVVDERPLLFPSEYKASPHP